MNDKRILDAACGSKMFWFDKKRADTIYIDNRILNDTLCDGRTLNINPDIVADFRNLPFDADSFYMVVFDPPHLVKLGSSSWMAKKYGVLGQEWKNDLKRGFDECFRVLKPNGTLIFKWNENQVKLSAILSLIPYQPLIGNQRGKTHWLVFMK